VIALTFVIARVVPGDPAVTYAGPRATPQQIAEVRAKFGLDKPAYKQLIDYVGGIFRGNWGTSLHTRQPVVSDLGRVVPPTLVLVCAALVLAVAVGLPLGAFAAHHHGRLGDVLSKVVAILAVSMPIFWLAILLQTLFFAHLGWFPVAGQYNPTLDYTSPLHPVVGVAVVDSLLTGNWPVFWSAAWHMVLPTVAIAAYPLGACALLTRAQLLDNLGEEHIRMVRALGFSERSVLSRFAMRPSLGPLASLIALVFAYSLTNSFLVESIFDWPGLGSYTIASIQSLDIPSILGVTLFVALIYVTLNLLVDLALVVIDPRTRP
jgi:peptide/nickel transport system permease protein